MSTRCIRWLGPDSVLTYALRCGQRMSVAQLTARLDQLAADPSKDPAGRVRALRDVKDDIHAERETDFDPDYESLLGKADTYIADNELRREADAHARHMGFVRARANADVRDEMVRRGIATPGELDSAGMWSHDQLDEMADDGVLGEALCELEEFFHIEWTAALHPRNRRGEWSSKPGQLPQVKGRGGEAVAHVVKDTGGFRQKAEELDTRVADETARGAHGHEPLASPGAAERDTGPVPDINAPPNPAGKVSQKALLAYAKRAASQPSTADTYGHIGADGKRVYDRSRQALHERIISKFLDHVPSQESPRVLFTGGGYASGKGAVVQKLKENGQAPRDALTLDPDRIKAELPEFKELLGHDPEANLVAYEEAWDIAQELQRRGMEKKANMIVDGLGDTSPEDMLARVNAFRDAGYVSPSAVYAHRPTDEAIDQAARRAEGSKKVESRRFIPETIMRSAHRDVSASLPGIIEGSKGDRGLDRIEVWDNTQGEGGEGFKEPRLAYSFAGGHETVHDPEAHQAFLDKANETVPGIDEPARADTLTALRQVEELGLNDWPEPGEVARRALGQARDTRELHTRPVPQSPGTTGEQQRAYTAARKQVHDQLVGRHLAKAVGGILGGDHPITQKLSTGGVLNENEKQTVRDAATQARGGEKPTALFMAGGPASGKSSALAQAPEVRPENAVHIDPDDLKAELPEYKRMAEGKDRYAANAVHEESSDLGRRLHSGACDLGLNMVVDGTGDSKPGKFAGKMRDADAAGYKVNSMYVTAPTHTAVVRAVRRAQQTGRLVPVPEIRNQHRNVSRNFDEVAKLPFLNDLRVYDTAAHSPRLIATGSHGELTEHDQRLMGEFRDKANE